MFVSWGARGFGFNVLCILSRHPGGCYALKIIETSSFAILALCGGWWELQMCMA